MEITLRICTAFFCCSLLKTSILTLPQAIIINTKTQDLKCVQEFSCDQFMVYTMQQYPSLGQTALQCLTIVLFV